MAFKCDRVDDWAVRYFPLFRFSKNAAQENEFFYPIDVDTGWLNHQAAGSDTGPNSNHDRGSAIFRWSPLGDDWEGEGAVVQAGAIQQDSSATGIGSPQFAARPDLSAGASAGEFGDWFLNFGGWCEVTTRLRGQNVYTWDLFKREMYDSLGLPASLEPTNLDLCENRGSLAPPQIFQPDSAGLHTYVEALEVGQLIEDIPTNQDLDNLPSDLQAFKAGAQTIQDQAISLKVDQVQALTYYLFYPGSIYRDANRQGERIREGDWEAITLFSNNLDNEVEFAAYSQGYQFNAYPMPLAVCRPFTSDDMVIQDGHPVAFVAWGSHANYFTDRRTAVESEPQINWMRATGIALGGIGLALVFGSVVSGPLAPILLGLATLVFIVALIILAYDVFFSQTPEDKPPFDRGPREDSHGGNGAAAGAGASGTAGSPPVTLPGTIPMIRHIVNAEGCQTPAWWTFAGRWGVCVDNAQSIVNGDGDRWVNGVTRRTAEGYTLAHRNLEAFFDHRSCAVDCQMRASYSHEFEAATDCECPR